MSASKTILFYCTLGILTVILLAVSICLGSVPIAPAELIRQIIGQGDEMFGEILWQLRLPRALAAAILGGGLALSGYLLQTFFRNPIAGPFLLGISSGAKLTVSLAMVGSLTLTLPLTSPILIAAAFIGAMLAMGFVLLLSRLVERMSLLIIAGVMIGYLCSAATDFIVTFADDANIVNLHNWSKGSFSGMRWENILVMSIVIFAAGIGAFLLSKPMGAYQLGEAYAQNLGVPVKRLRILMILLTSVLSACVTAFAGPISFVGVAAPHLIRGILRTERPILLIPSVFLGGAIFCLFSDLLARMLFAPTELSISTVTAVFGAPVVLVLLIRRKRREQ